MLLALGVNHKTAPIEIREKVAFSPEHIPNALKTFINQGVLEEVALISTCNRTEIYCGTKSFLVQPSQVLECWQQHLAAPFLFEPYLYVHSDEMAAKHIMRVASGLDSMVVGEPQILGQLKSAFATAQDAGVVGTMLSRLFQSSFSVAKKVRQESGISKHPVSIAFAAVTLAKQIFSELSKTTVLLIGAGENIELILKHMSGKNIKKIIIINRTFTHATALAQNYGATPLPFTELAAALKEADIVMSSVFAPSVILSQKDMERAFAGCKRRPVLMVDLGVPRNIDPQTASHEDIYLYTVDDLQGIIKENLHCRIEAAKDAEKIIDLAANEYMQWVHGRQNIHVLGNWRAESEKVKEEMLQIAFQRLENGEDPKTVMKEFGHRLTQRLLHQPTVELKEILKKMRENPVTS